jgi:hypothetical protein
MHACTSISTEENSISDETTCVLDSVVSTQHGGKQPCFIAPGAPSVQQGYALATPGAGRSLLVCVLTPAALLISSVTPGAVN